jgi:hypothetical protein
MQACLASGPFAVSMTVFPDLGSYKSGVYTCKGERSSEHARGRCICHSARSFAVRPQEFLSQGKSGMTAPPSSLGKSAGAEGHSVVIIGWGVQVG